jgi:hypothetical protein
MNWNLKKIIWSFSMYKKNKLYLTRVVCYKSYSERKVKCDISTIPVESMQSSHGTIVYKSQVSPEIIELSQKKRDDKFFSREVNYLKQIVVYYYFFVSNDLEAASKQSLEEIKQHFGKHHFLLKSLYKKFTNVLVSYIFN